MKRTLIVVAIALTVLLAGCGGPGDAPGDNETPGEDPGAGGPGEEDPTGEEEPAGDGTEPRLTPPAPAGAAIG